MGHALLEPAPFAADPLDVVEQVVLANDWVFDRLSEDEVAAEVSGQGYVFHLWFARRRDREALQFSCAFDVRVPEHRRDALYPLLAMINERLWIGHFDLWSEDGIVMFRQTLPLRGGVCVGGAQVSDLIDTAIAECERFYPAFQYVVWGGKPASDAIAVALMETVGEA